MVFEFIPIALEPMSVITATFLTFIGITGVFILKNINQQLDSHDNSINEFKETLTEIKIDVAETRVMIDNIEKDISKITVQYSEILGLLMGR